MQLGWVSWVSRVGCKINSALAVASKQEQDLQSSRVEESRAGASREVRGQTTSVVARPDLKSENLNFLVLVTSVTWLFLGYYTVF